MPGSINLTALNNNLGAYCREHANEIFADMLLGLEESLSKTGITVLDNIKDEYILPNLMVGDLIKPGDYQNFNPGNDTIAFDNRTLKVRPFKVDLLIYPQQFEATWLTHLRKSKGTYTKDNFPFYQFLMGEVIKKAKRELRFAIWRAVYNGAGNGWADICDGVLKLIADDVIAGKIIEVATGTIDKTNVVAAVEAVCEGLGDDYAEKPGYCVVSRSLFQMYIKAPGTSVDRDIRFNELSGETNAAGQKAIYVRGTNIELVPEPSLGSSQRIIASTEDNFFMGTDTVNEFNDIKTQEFNRSIKFMLDGKIGVNYALANATYKPISTNDQN